jgi:hypothetical protein
MHQHISSERRNVPTPGAMVVGIAGVTEGTIGRKKIKNNT